MGNLAKVYAIEYDFKFITFNKLDSDEYEHKTESFTDLNKFMERVKYLSEHDTTQCGIRYIENMKTYVGDLVEISIEKVLNPF